MRARNYVLAVVVPLLLALLIVLFVVLEPGASELLVLLPLAAIPVAVATAVLVVRMWAAIRDDETRPSPAAALLGLLVPVFNFYWAFRVWAGWPRAYAAYARRAGVTVPPVSRSATTAMVVLTLTSNVLTILALPLAAGNQDAFLLMLPGMMASIGALVLFFVVAAQVCTAVNRLKEAVPTVLR